MTRELFVAALLLAAAVPCRAAGPEVSGQVRSEWIHPLADPRGPIAAADRIEPGFVGAPPSGAGVDAEVRASGHGINAVATLQSRPLGANASTSRAFFNELYGSADAAGWQLSAGKKIVAWDVGYGFRPNDFVEQETRRTLLTVTPEGRPVLTAEHFDASTAWALVVVNPTHSRADRGAKEPAMAARVYERDGAVDWHGFARLGVRTGASLGAAFAWVANESLELHASARTLTRADTLASDAPASALLRSDPWQAASVRHPAQLLAGGTWTNADQLSLLAEAWWDGTALSNSQWDKWNARSRGLGALIGSPAPAAAIAGNLAWQADAFNASSNLRRANLFARLSWQYDKWQPAIDVLCTPADSGRIVTAALGWQGDRVRVDAGVRVYGGPDGALLAQLPKRRIAYAAVTWAY